jgi:hypothetical protein
MKYVLKAYVSVGIVVSALVIGFVSVKNIGYKIAKNSFGNSTRNGNSVVKCNEY